MVERIIAPPRSPDFTPIALTTISAISGGGQFFTGTKKDPYTASITSNKKNHINTMGWQYPNKIGTPHPKCHYHGTNNNSVDIWSTP